jgi:hypothetical protein
VLKIKPLQPSYDWQATDYWEAQVHARMSHVGQCLSHSRCECAPHFARLYHASSAGPVFALNMSLPESDVRRREM